MEKANRGFGALSPEQKRKISSMGGKAAHASGKAHEWTHEQAKIAGRKGGQAMRKKAQEADRRRVEAEFGSENPGEV